MLDIRTIMLVGTASFFVCAFLLWLLWLKAKGRITGIGSWAMGFSCEVFGILLVALRGKLPDLLSITLANLFIQGGIILIYRGYSVFVGLPRRLWPDLLLLAVYGAVHAWFTYVHPNLEARDLALAACMGILCLQIALVLLAAPTGKGPARFCALVNLAYVAENLARIGLSLKSGPGAEDFMRAGQVEALWQVGYQLLFLVETAGMVYMVFERLNVRLSESEEKFSKAFQTSPCAIAITDAESGRIEEANAAFAAISGHTVEESLGKTSATLGLWSDDARREAILKEVLDSGRMSWRDVRFRGREGSKIDALAAAETLSIGGRKAILWTVNDISERKRMEESIRALLAEKETLLKEIHHRVKNNMASVAGLLSIEAAEFGERDRAGAVLEEASRQVRSMAVLYERIYRTEHYESMPLDEFLGPLVRETLSSYPESRSVRLDLGLDSRPVPPRLLLSLGMMATELVCNAMKHAYAGRTGGSFSVRSSGETTLVLEFADDGPGFDPSARRPGGFGLTMVQALAEQARGGMSIDCSQGCRIRVELSTEG